MELTKHFFNPKVNLPALAILRLVNLYGKRTPFSLTYIPHLLPTRIDLANDRITVNSAFFVVIREIRIQ